MAYQSVWWLWEESLMRPLFWMSPTLMRGSEKCRLNVLLFSDLNFAKVLIDRLNMLMFLYVQGIRKIWYSYANQRHSRGSCHSYLITCKSVIPAYFKFVMKYCVSNAVKKKLPPLFVSAITRPLLWKWACAHPSKSLFRGGGIEHRTRENSRIRAYPSPHHTYTHTHTRTPPSLKQSWRYHLFSWVERYTMRGGG